jgi:RNA polymerase sigma-70 factor, ECF subfamily
MLNDVQNLPPNRARFEARVSDLEDIDQLVRVHRPSVLRHAWWLLKDKDLAETVTQDCFLRAFKARAFYRGQCSVRTWLLAIATNLVRDQTRARGFQFWKYVRTSAVDVTEMESRLVCRQQTPESNLLMREKLRHVWATVDGLPGRQKTVFSLRFVEEMRVSEIAEATGLNLSTVKSLLYRALRTIRVELEKAGRAPSAPGIGRFAISTDFAASGNNPPRQPHSGLRGPSVRTGSLVHQSLSPAGQHARLPPPSVQGGGNGLRVSSLGLS